MAHEETSKQKQPNILSQILRARLGLRPKGEQENLEAQQRLGLITTQNQIDKAETDAIEDASRRRQLFVRELAGLRGAFKDDALFFQAIKDSPELQATVDSAGIPLEAIIGSVQPQGPVEFGDGLPAEDVSLERLLTSINPQDIEEFFLNFEGPQFAAGQSLAVGNPAGVGAAAGGAAQVEQILTNPELAGPAAEIAAGLRVSADTEARAGGGLNFRDRFFNTVLNDALDQGLIGSIENIDLRDPAFQAQLTAKVAAANADLLGIEKDKKIADRDKAKALRDAALKEGSKLLEITPTQFAVEFDRNFDRFAQFIPSKQIFGPAGVERLDFQFDKNTEVLLPGTQTPVKNLAELTQTAMEATFRSLALGQLTGQRGVGEGARLFDLLNGAPVQNPTGQASTLSEIDKEIARRKALADGR